MAVVVDSQEPSQTGHASGTSPMTWSFNNVAGTVLYVGVTADFGAANNGTTTTSVSYNSVPLTRVALLPYGFGSNSNEVSIWRLLNPATGSHTVSVSATGIDNICAGAISFTGNHPTTPEGSPSSAKVESGSGTTSASVTVSGTTSGNYVLAALDTGSGYLSTSNTLSWSQVGVLTNSPGDYAAMTYQSVSSSSTTMTDTIAQDWWGIVAIEIKAAIVFVKCTLLEAVLSGSVTGPFTSTAGNQLILLAQEYAAGTGTMTVTGGGTWTVDHHGSTLNNMRTASASCPSATGGSQSVTVAFSSGTGTNVYILEFSGLATAGVFEGAGSTTTGTTNSGLSTSALTNTGANAVKVAHIAVDNGASAAWTTTGSGWIMPTNGNEGDGTQQFVGAVAYKIVSASQSDTETWTYGSSSSFNAWTADIRTYLAAPTGPGATAAATARMVASINQLILPIADTRNG